MFWNSIVSVSQEEKVTGPIAGGIPCPKGKNRLNFEQLL